MGIHDLWPFILAVSCRSLAERTPGPDMALILAWTTQRGALAEM